MCSHLNRLTEAILIRTQNIPFSIYKKRKFPYLSQICSYEIFSKGFKNEFETAVVNEPSVFEPLKVYCKMKMEGYAQNALIYRLIIVLLVRTFSQ